MSPLFKGFADADEMQPDRDGQLLCVSVFTASVRAECLGNGVETCGVKAISGEAP